MKLKQLQANAMHIHDSIVQYKNYTVLTKLWSPSMANIFTSPY